MSALKFDVLATMNAAAQWCAGKSQHGSDLGLTAARAVVAELIERANDATASGCPCDTCEALRAAVRNCGGAE